MNNSADFNDSAIRDGRTILFRVWQRLVNENIQGIIHHDADRAISAQQGADIVLRLLRSSGVTVKQRAKPKPFKASHHTSTMRTRPTKQYKANKSYFVKNEARERD